MIDIAAAVNSKMHDTKKKKEAEGMILVLHITHATGQNYHKVTENTQKKTFRLVIHSAIYKYYTVNER